MHIHPTIFGLLLFSYFFNISEFLKLSKGKVSMFLWIWFLSSIQIQKLCFLSLCFLRYFHFWQLPHHFPVVLVLCLFFIAYISPPYFSLALCISSSRRRAKDVNSLILMPFWYWNFIYFMRKKNMEVIKQNWAFWQMLVIGYKDQKNRK